MDAVYQIYHVVETHTVFDGVFETEESAKAEAERLHKETGRTYKVYRTEVKP